jgi:hypothetical protein
MDLLSCTGLPHGASSIRIKRPRATVARMLPALRLFITVSAPWLYTWVMLGCAIRARYWTLVPELGRDLCRGWCSASTSTVPAVLSMAPARPRVSLAPDSSMD